MPQSTPPTTATTNNRKPNWKGERLMLIKRILRALLITGIVAISAAVTLSASRNSWPRGATVNNSVLAVGGCHKVKGNESLVQTSPTTASGTITRGGILNGTTMVVITSAFTPTPDPATFSFTDDFTLTTQKGVLVTHNVTILNVVSGVGTAIARIDPNASTGDFAGATGVLFFSGGAGEVEITGEICFAD